MRLRGWIVCTLAGALASCGGGGGGGGNSPTPPPVDTDRAKLTASMVVTPVPSSWNSDIDFVVTNPSVRNANDVEVVVTLGNMLNRVGLQCTASNGATCPDTPNSMLVPTLPSGGTLRYRMTVAVPSGAGRTYTTTATVTASNDADSTNNTATVTFIAYTTNVVVTASTTSAEVLAGNSIPYRFTLTNSGPEDAHNLVLDHVLSVGETFASATCTASGGATCPASIDASTPVPTLPVGGSLIIDSIVQVSSDAVFSVRGALRATTPGDTAPADNLATVETPTRIPTSSGTPTFVNVQSDLDDGMGVPLRHYSYTRANSVLTLTEDLGVVRLDISGSQDWHGVFFMPANLSQVTRGTYVNSSRTTDANQADPSTGGMDWSGYGGCRHTEVFTVDDVVYTNGQLASLDLRFEQHCDGKPPAVRGQIHWVAGDESQPPGPVDPPPVGLWRPAAGATPSSGNFVYFESEGPREPIEQGVTQIFTQANSELTVQHVAGELSVHVHGNDLMDARFKVMSPRTQMAPGYYADVEELPFGNPALGQMAVYGNGRACGGISGWFVIDSISFSLSGVITSVDARFEQRCGGVAQALHGQIHWRTDDPTQPPGPTEPPPGLWSPPADAIPASGNFFYAESDSPFEWVGQGLKRLYTPLDSVIELGGPWPATGNLFQIAVHGDEEWRGLFRTMSTLSDLKVGYYGNLLAYPMSNPALGSQEWVAEGRSGAGGNGWVIIDSVTYAGDQLQSITLRFAQWSAWAPENGTLHGMVRWSADDTRLPTPPQNPPPVGLWDAPAGATPASGNYFYAESAPGDIAGGGETYLYTPLNATFHTQINYGGAVGVTVWGDVRWIGDLQSMVPFTQLQTGYYYMPNGPSPARGQMGWSGHFACPDRIGWTVVDSVQYDSNGSLTALDVRFEQLCAPGQPPLHGKLHWRNDDMRQPPGPVNPPPAGLWTPPADQIPASGNFLYFESDPGDFVGQGNTALRTPADSTFTPLPSDRTEMILVSNSPTFDFSGSFREMSSIPRLQPGYYPNAQRAGFGNPTLGGLDITAYNRACFQVTGGWFVVNSVTYDGDTLTALDVTWEQYCDWNTTDSSRGRLRWSQ